MTTTEPTGVDDFGADTTQGTPTGDGAASGPTVGGTAPWKPPRSYVAAVAILVAIGFGLGALSLVFAGRLGDDAADEVRRTSADFATALLTYDHGDLDATKNRVLSYATAGFKQQYEQAFTGGLDVLLKETEARSRVTDVQVYVDAVDGNAASAIAVVDTVAEGSSGTRRTLNTYVQLELVKVDGAWKIGAVINLNFGQPAEGAAGVPTPTTEGRSSK